MSVRVDLKGKIYGYLKVINFKTIKHTHAYWNCHCGYCGRDTVVRGTDLHTNKIIRCKRCIKRIFNIEESLEIAKRVSNGETKISIQKDLKCSSTAIYSALKLVKDKQ